MSAHFNALFEQLDNNKVDLGIKEYTVRSSTLEEVFISLGENEQKKKPEQNQLASWPDTMGYMPTV